MAAKAQGKKTQKSSGAKSSKLQKTKDKSSAKPKTSAKAVAKSSKSSAKSEKKTVPTKSTQKKAGMKASLQTSKKAVVKSPDKKASTEKQAAKDVNKKSSSKLSGSIAKSKVAKDRPSPVAEKIKTKAGKPDLKEASKKKSVDKKQVNSVQKPAKAVPRKSPVTKETGKKQAANAHVSPDQQVDSKKKETPAVVSKPDSTGAEIKTKPSAGKPQKTAAVSKKTGAQSVSSGTYKSAKTLKEDPGSSQKSGKPKSVSPAESVPPPPSVGTPSSTSEGVKKSGGKKDVDPNEDEVLKPIDIQDLPPELLADSLLADVDLPKVKKPLKPLKKTVTPEKKTRRESGLAVSKGVTIPDRFDEPLSAEVTKGKLKSKRFQLEFSINSATHILFNYVSTSSGLKEWFADEVLEKGDLFTFYWSGSTQVAKLISLREDHHVRFHWLDRVEGTYFEFRLERDFLTDDLALVVVDFFEEGESEETARLLWESQIESLFKIIGAHS